MEKLITVVIPCYNYAKYLTECVASVRRQTYKNIEIIVVNDGSPDNTEEVCKKLGVTCLTKPNGGLSSARNYGIKHAKGEYIMCLDADDILPDDSIEHHLKNAGPGIISQCGMMEFEASFAFWNPKENSTLENVKYGNTIYCNAVFNKKDWESVGGYDESETMRLGYEDWEFWIRMLKHGCVIKTSMETGLLYRIHMSSMTRTKTHTNKEKLLKYIKEKHKELYEE